MTSYPMLETGAFMSKKALTVRIEEEEHKAIMKHLIDEGISFQEYVLELIRKDMASINK